MQYELLIACFDKKLIPNSEFYLTNEFWWKNNKKQDWSKIRNSARVTLFFSITAQLEVSQRKFDEINGL